MHDRLEKHADAYALFYSSDEDRDAGVAAFLGEGVAQGEAILLLVPAERLSAIADRLDAEVTHADAQEMLRKILAGGMPDWDLFVEHVGGAIDRAAQGRRVRVYGEMVDLLWRDGQTKAAIKLEEIWSAYLSAKRDRVCCTYAMGGMLKEVIAEASTHASGVRPAGRDRAALAAEIALRDQIERALRESLRDQEAERRAAHKDRLMKITAAIADAVTPAQVFEAVTDDTAVALGASTGSLWELDAGRATLRRAFGWSPEQQSSFADVPLASDRRFPGLDVLRSGEPLWIGSQEELLAAYPELAEVVTRGRAYSIACLPIVVEGRTLGSLAFTFDDMDRIEDDAKALLLVVARHAGQALERLRLLAAERKSRANAEALAARAAALSRASHAFAECGPDLRELLDTIARALRDHADGCAVMLVEGDAGTLEIGGGYHRDPAAEASLRAAVAAHPLALGVGSMGIVAQSGEPIFAPEIERSALLEGAYPTLRAWLEEHTPHSVVVVPMRSRGRVIGTLTALRETMAAPFDHDDLRMCEELAERAATAIENARLSRDNQEARARAELLYGLARAVITAARIEDVAEAALDATERALGATRSSIRVLDADGVARFTASRRMPESLRGAVEGHFPWPRDARDAQPILVADASAVPALAKENIRSVVYVPLAVDGRLVGKLTVYYERERTLSRQESEVVIAIANHVAAAVVRFAAISALEQSVRDSEIFVGVLGHDLRNPLGAILTGAQLLMMREQGGANVKPLARIAASGQRMARMIDQLLDFTRLRIAGGIPLHPRKVELEVLLRQVIEELEVAHPACRVSLACEADSVGVWDEDRLLQVFSNLVGNAVQHGVASDGVDVRIEASAQHVCVRIHNGGVIPPELVPRLFEPMARGRRVSSHGLGLGLFIARRLTIAHGGELSVESSEGAGTTMTVTLPRVTPGGKTA